MRYHARITILTSRRDGEPMMTWKHPNANGSTCRMKDEEYYHLEAKTRRELDDMIYRELVEQGSRKDPMKYKVVPLVKIEKRY